MTTSAIELESTGGELYCHVFENESTGLGLDLFWSVTLNVIPPTSSASDPLCALTCEWLRFPVRNWRNLDGVVDEYSDGDSEKQASMYWLTHHPARKAKLQISRHKGVEFTASIEMELDYVDQEFARLAGSSTVRSWGVIDYLGLILLPSNLSAHSLAPTQMDNFVSKFVDLSVYNEKEAYNTGYLYRPCEPNSEPESL